MLSNRLVFVGLAAACVMAAGVGGYIASRQNATNAVPVAAASPAPAPTSSATPPERPVQETEALVGDTPKSTTPVASPSNAPAAPAKRAESSTSRSTIASRVPSRPATAQSARQAPPPLTQTWPSGASANPLPGATPANPPGADAGATAVRPDDRASADASRSQEPAAKTYEELVVSADSVLGLQTENPISSEQARVEDVVNARVTRDVRVGDKVAIPSGTRAIGSVTQVERGGKFKEQARLGIRFHTLVLADGTRVPISTDTIYREGSAPTSAQKIGGGAVIGTIIGAIAGGGKGAIIGGAAGAGAGTAATMAGQRSEAVLPAGTPMTVRIVSPVTITVEQKD